MQRGQFPFDTLTTFTDCQRTYLNISTTADIAYEVLPARTASTRRCAYAHMPRIQYTRDSYISFKSWSPLKLY